MERKKQFLTFALLILGIMVIIPYAVNGEGEEQEDYSETQSGVPDVVSSRSMNNDHYLKVVANCDKLEDEEEFARTVIHMCQDNAFHSIKFSTDYGYPVKLDIDVYLSISDIEARNEPVCVIQFKTDDFNENYNIKDNADKYRLFVDNKEIEFY